MIRLVHPITVIAIFLCLCAAGPSVAQIADFSMSPSSGCAPLVVSFTNLSSGGITSHSWNLGNSTSSSLKDPSTTYLNPGKYPVTLTVTGPTGSDTKTDTVTVYDKPAVSFAATTPLAGCAPHQVQFTSAVLANAPGNVSYSWNFGDGNTGTGASPAHTYVTAGTYTVTLTVVSGAGCGNTVVRNAYITAHPRPAGNFSASATAFCSVPATVSFANTSTSGTPPFTTSWAFGDGGTGTGNNTSYTYSTGGNFTVSMFVSDAHGCTDTLVRNSYIAINAVPATFSVPATICEDQNTYFVLTTPGSTWAHWDFGDGDTAFGTSGTHVYESPGNYTVTMTTAIGTCTKLAARSITVHPRPAATITMSPPVPCPAPVTVGFSGNSLHATSYSWIWKNGGTATGQSTSKNYLPRPAGYEHDELMLITTSSVGCVDTTVMDTVYIRDILTGVDPGGSPCIRDVVRGCFPFTVDFQAYLKSNLAPPPPGICTQFPYPLPINSWKWDFGDGSPISAAAQPSHTYVNAGTYNVKVLITTPNGCVDSGSTVVHADTPVTPSFTVSPLTTCQNSLVVYTNTTAKSLVNTAYDWRILDANTGDPDTTEFVIDSIRIGTRIREARWYTVWLYSDHRGCKDTAVRYSYVKINPPDAQFVDSQYCAPSATTVKFINKTDSSTSQFWDFGDGHTSTAFSPVHTYASLGLYSVTLISFNSTYGCSDTLVKLVRLEQPSFNYILSDSTICTGEGIQFFANFYGLGKHEFSWLIDSIQTPFDTIDNYAYWFNDRGYFDITLLLRINQCIDTLTKPRQVLVARPDVYFIADPPIGCLPLTIQFRDSSTNTPGVPTMSRVWAFEPGDTLKGNQAVVNHTYTRTGRHDVYLVIRDSVGCESLLYPFDGFDSIFVFKPKAGFMASDSGLCLYEHAVFTDTSAAARHLQHHWDFGDGTAGSGNPVSHAYTARGRYNVSLIVTDTVGCTDTFTLADTVRVDAPFAGFSMSDSIAICPPKQITFTNHSADATTYTWDFGTGASPIVVTNPVYPFTDRGLFTVTLVATNTNGCSDTARDTVRILGYDGAFSYTPLTGCLPLTVQFTTPLTGIPQITWDFDDGNIRTGSSPSYSYTYTSTGTFHPKAIFTDGPDCTASSAGLDSIRVDRVYADFSWSVPCMGVPFTLKDSSAALFNAPVSWSWYFSGSTDTAAGPVASYAFSTGGNHPVTLVAANASGCADTITKDVFINYLPPVQLPADTGVCPHDTAALVATGAQTYTWSPSPDFLRNCPACDSAFVHIDNDTPGVGTVYTVTGTDINGCINKDSIRVFIQLKTTSTTGDGGEICVGDTFRLHAAGAQRYEWMPAATIDSPFIASPLARPERTTTYIVAAREGTCLVDSQRVVVVVRSQPLFSAGNDETIAAGSAVTLQPTQPGISRIAWRQDSTLSCVDCFRPNAYPLYTTTYYATGYNEYGCYVSDSVTVYVRCNGNLVFIPNTFTPNGDGRNDYFYPRGKGIELMTSFRVYNRWGELVFERSNVGVNDERAGWDGTYKGKELPPDVYVYVMQSNCSTGEPLLWKGDIAIVK